MSTDAHVAFVHGRLNQLQWLLGGLYALLATLTTALIVQWEPRCAPPEGRWPTLSGWLIWGALLWAALFALYQGGGSWVAANVLAWLERERPVHYCLPTSGWKHGLRLGLYQVSHTLPAVALFWLSPLFLNLAKHASGCAARWMTIAGAAITLAFLAGIVSLMVWPSIKEVRRKSGNGPGAGEGAAGTAATPGQDLVNRQDRTADGE